MRRVIIGVIGRGEGAVTADEVNARKLGELIAAQGWVLLTGGRDAGVMRAATEGAALVEGSVTVGILPGGSRHAAASVDIAIVTGMGSARNNINVLSSDVVVACGVSGAGTASEVALAIKAGRPVVLLGADPLAAGFFRQLGGPAVELAETAEEALLVIRRRVIPPASDATES